MPGERPDAAGGCAPATVWLVGLRRELAHEAQASLAAHGLAVGRARSTADGCRVVAVIGSPLAPAADQRREALAAVERLSPVHVVAITDLEQRSALQRLVATGIHGLVMAEDIETTLPITVRAVAAGQICVPDETRASVAPRPLSTRERQILATVIMGLSNGEIAKRLYIAESTVKSHLASIFDKLGVRSRAEAAELVTDPEDMLGTGIVTISGEVRRD